MSTPEHLSAMPYHIPDHRSLGTRGSRPRAFRKVRDGEGAIVSAGLALAREGACASRIIHPLKAGNSRVISRVPASLITSHYLLTVSAAASDEAWVLE
jgi:hypothetical protein